MPIPLIIAIAVLMGGLMGHDAGNVIAGKRCINSPNQVCQQTPEAPKK